MKYHGAGNAGFIGVAISAGTDVSNVQVVIDNPNGTVLGFVAFNDGAPVTATYGLQTH